MKFTTKDKLILGVIFLSILALVTFLFLISYFLKSHPISTNWLIFIFAAMIIAAWIIDTLEKKKNTEEKASFLRIALQVLPNYEDGFADFYNLYFKDKKKFLSQNAALLKDTSNFDLKNLKPIEVLYLFAEEKNLVQLIDAAGEENDMEIEVFIETFLSQKPDWTNTSKLRTDLNEDKRRDGNFIVALFKAIDKDLKQIDKRLLFFEMQWDAYLYTVVSLKAFNDIKGRPSTYFSGAGKLRK